MAALKIARPLVFPCRPLSKVGARCRLRRWLLQERDPDVPRLIADQDMDEVHAALHARALLVATIPGDKVSPRRLRSAGQIAHEPPGEIVDAMAR